MCPVRSVAGESFRSVTASSLKSVACAALAAVLPFFALASLLPQAFSLRVPLDYSGDGLSHGILVRSVLEAGWFPTHNPRLGAPFGATWFDYPNADAANLLILKITGLFSNDWIIATNVFYLITFALTSVIAFSVLQRLGLRWLYALAATVAAIAVATVMVQLGPTFVYWYENGTNRQVAHRPPSEAELFAFKPIQLLLPQSEHRIRLARDFANGYARSTPLVNENASA